LAATPNSSQQTQVATPRSSGGAGVRRAPQPEAFEEIFRVARERGWGTRVTLIGGSGKGKTYAIARMCAYAIESGAADLILVHDQKDPTPQADYLAVGTHRLSLADFAARPLGSVQGDQGPIVILHGAQLDHPDRVCEAARAVANKTGLRVTVVVDELFKALSGERTFESGVTGPTALMYREGRSQGLGIICSTQIPQSIPTTCISLSEHIVIFGTKARASEYVVRQAAIEREAEGLIPTLGMGEFLLARPDAPWDSTIYGPG
jgi:hypothetical protein